VPVKQRHIDGTGQLLAGFETGAIDAAVVYRSMAEERGYPYVDLPAAIDLSDPDHAADYSVTDYVLPDGTRVRGDVITYAATGRVDRPGSTAVFEGIVNGGYLQSHGFGVPDDYPSYGGAVPDGLP
jgi:molybdate/tungstate transport system substrate-binding protein